MTCMLCLKRKNSNGGFMSVCIVLILKLCTCVCVCARARPQAGAGLREAVVTVIWTCQFARRGSADKLQIVSIADERSAGDAGGVTLDWPLLNKSHLPPSSRRPYLQQQSWECPPPSAAFRPLPNSSPLLPIPSSLLPPPPPPPSPLPAYLG